MSPVLSCLFSSSLHSFSLYSKLRIGHTEQCPCGTGSQTTEHLLQSCPICEPLRKGIWPDHTAVARKLYGSLRDLRCTATKRSGERKRLTFHPPRLRMICVQPDKYWHGFEGNLGENAKRRDGACMGLSERYDALLS